MIKANRITSYCEEIRRNILQFEQLCIEDGVDFVGCSEMYTAEKIDFLINSLKLFRNNLNRIDKRQND